MKATIHTRGVYFVTGIPGLKFNGLPLSDWDQPLIQAGNLWMTRFEAGDTVDYPEDGVLPLTVQYVAEYDWNGIDGAEKG